MSEKYVPLLVVAERVKETLLELDKKYNTIAVCMGIEDYQKMLKESGEFDVKALASTLAVELRDEAAKINTTTS